MSEITKGRWAAKGRFANVITKLLVLGIGAWVGVQLWPHIKERMAAESPKTDAPAMAQQPIAPPPAAPDVTTSLLGTDASASEKPLQLVLVGTVRGASLAESRAMLG